MQLDFADIGSETATLWLLLLVSFVTVLKSSNKSHRFNIGTEKSRS